MQSLSTTIGTERAIKLFLLFSEDICVRDQKVNMRTERMSCANILAQLKK